jgi:hypothetical protein
VRELRCELAALRFRLALKRLIDHCAKAGYDPTQPRVPAGHPDGGQWTREGGAFAQPASADAGDDVILTQTAERQPSILFEALLARGGRSLGRFGSRISIAVSRGVEEQEGFDAHSKRTTLSLTGVGFAVVDVTNGDTVSSSVYQIGTPSNPDRGLSITIDADDNLNVAPTRGS